MFGTILLSKGLLFFSRILEKDPAGAGKLALFLDKRILQKLLAGVTREVIVILGTTGKTTTRSVIMEILRKEGDHVAGNPYRRKDRYGIVGALLEQARLTRGLGADYVVLELGDLETLSLLPLLDPRHVIITNILKEQISRKDSLEETLAGMEAALGKIPAAELILNGDDPLVVGLTETLPNPKTYFGVEAEGEGGQAHEPFLCPRCKEPLSYEARRYSQLGSWSCPGCGLDNPALDYLARNITLKDGLYFDFVSAGEEYPFDLPGQGVYNIYNILGALALAEELGLGVEAAELALEVPGFLKLELVTYYIRKPVFFYEAEGEAHFLRSLEILDEDREGTLDLLFLNEASPMEEENAFLWNLPLGILKKEKIRRIYLTGDRAFDMALAIRYQGGNQNRIQVLEDPEEALKAALGGKGDKLYVICRGEGAESLRKRLEDREKEWRLR